MNFYLDFLFFYFLSYKKEHPEKAKDEYDMDTEKWFESQGERELKQIFDIQNSMFQVLRDLNKRLDELHGRQELVLSKVSSGSGGVQMVQQGQGQPIAVPETIKRHEVEMVIGNQNDIRRQMQDVRQMIDQLKEKADRMGGGGGGGSINMDLQMSIHEVNDHVKQIREDTANMLKTPQQPLGSNCPSVTCISPTIFFIGLAVQIVALSVYAVYKQNREARAKKFY